MPDSSPAREQLQARVDELARRVVTLERACAEKSRLEDGGIDEVEGALLDEVSALQREVSVRARALSTLEQKMREAQRGPERSQVRRTFARRFFVLAGWLVPSAWLLGAAGHAMGLFALASLPATVLAARGLGRWAS